MEPLTVLNGITDPELSKQIEKYARIDGFRVRNVENPLDRNYMNESNILFVDRKGLEFYQDLPEQIAEDKWPLIIIPVLQKGTDSNHNYSKNTVNGERYPFQFWDFHSTVTCYIPDNMMKYRSFDYGVLYVDKEQRIVLYKNQKVDLGPYEFDILVFMLEHMGEAIGRMKINHILPERKRKNTRNIDTHIKNIRNKLNMKRIILSVRSIGYRIDEEKFYEWTFT